MSRSQETLSVKRKRQEPNTISVSPEDVLLDLIKSKGDMGIWKGDMKRETNLSEPVVNKALKTLQGRKLIKEVVNIKSKGRKHYMAAEFEPSKEITGGTWYTEGNLDTTFIGELKDLCLKVIRKLKVGTAEEICDFLIKNRVTKVECTNQQIQDILESMVLDNEIVVVKSTGLGEFHSIRVGTNCYKTASGMGLGQGPKIGAMASIPCGVCPRINQCTPDGIISPKTCVYYKKWLLMNLKNGRKAYLGPKTVTRRCLFKGQPGAAPKMNQTLLSWLKNWRLQVLSSLLRIWVDADKCSGCWTSK